MSGSDNTGGDSTIIDRVLAGRYRLAGLIGVGGMGQVYRAMQLSMEREVAVKILRPDICTDLETRDVWIARFRRGVDALSRLQHPNTHLRTQVAQAAAMQLPICWA